jgi:hypothetical protein
VIHSKCWGSKVLFAALTTVACLLSSVAQAQLTFTADAINGKIVNEETGAPLAGVIIVAEWYVQERLVGRGNGLLNVMETVSDKDGNYGFPSWGPKLLPMSPYPIFGSGNDPLVLYFKNGYWPAIESNDASDPESIATRKPPLGGFQANGKAIKLRKWDGKNEREYYDKVRFMVDQLNGGWKKYPRMTLAIDRIFQMLVQREKRKEIPPFFPTPHIVFIETLSAEEQAYLKGFAE